MVDLLISFTAQIEVPEALLVVEGLDGGLADNFDGISEVFKAHGPAASTESD